MPALTQQLSGPEFERMLADLHAISAEPTLEQIRAVMVRYGIKSPSAKDGTPSNGAATTLRDGPFKRYVERLHAGRDTREALCAAAGAGVHPLDAIEEAMVIELQDHLIAPEGGAIDIKFVIGQLVKLRMAISMREESHRKQADLERKQKETEAKLELAEQREELLKQQIALFQRKQTDWEEQRAKLQAAVTTAAKKGGITPATRKLIEDVMAGRNAA